MREADYEALLQGPNAWARFLARMQEEERCWSPDLSFANLRRVDLRGVDLAGADLTFAKLRKAILRDADLSGANLRNANLSKAALAGADLTGADLTCADLSGADLVRADLSNADLFGANLREADLREGYLRGANLRGANLSEANLKYADLSDRPGASEALIARSEPCVNLSDANLSRAELADANLKGAVLSHANLSGADLMSVNLSGAKLDGANLSEAELWHADLTGVDLTGAELSRATLGGTTLAILDASALCEGEGLGHAAPSTIDARTVMLSFHHAGFKAFMAACGVPWIFIEYMVDCAKAETAEDLRALMQSTFISYGQPDDSFARRLYESLTARRITVFYFPETARWGERLSNEVHTQLNSHDRVILICSEHSLNRPGVRNEIQETFDREARDGGATYLLPLVLDGYLFDPNGWESVEPDLTRRVRARIAGDFRNAQTDPAQYDKALGRLIDVLKKTHP